MLILITPNMVKTIVVPSIIVILVIAFYKLAKKHNRSHWYGSLGILVFLISFFIAEVITNRLSAFLLRNELIENSSFLKLYYLFVFTVLVIAIILCRIGYKLVEREWEKDNIIISNPDILDEEILE